MAYDEEQRKRSRVVVETPAARREVVETQVDRIPERRGISTGAVAALVIGAVALVTIIFLFVLDRQQAENANLRVNTAPTPIPQTTIIQQPAPIQQQQPPVIVQPPPATTTQPVIVTQPAPATTTPGSTDSTTGTSGTDDSAIQAGVDRKISESPDLSSLGVIAAVANGKVTLTGSVDSAEQKRSVERAVRSVKGVKAVDNRITVSGGAEPSTSPE